MVNLCGQGYWILFNITLWDMHNYGEKGLGMMPFRFSDWNYLCSSYDYRTCSKFTWTYDIIVIWFTFHFKRCKLLIFAIKFYKMFSIWSFRIQSITLQLKIPKNHLFFIFIIYTRYNIVKVLLVKILGILGVRTRKIDNLCLWHILQH